jgi:hypothetical protein
VTAREISESRTRLGVVLLRDYAVPELLRVKHRIDARTDPEKARQEIVAWIKRLRDMRRLVETKAPSVFLPDPPQDFVSRTEALEALYAALVEKQDKALLHGEPGCGKSTLALEFAWQTQGSFDAVVFQLCGQRPVAGIAAELAAKPRPYFPAAAARFLPVYHFVESLSCPEGSSVCRRAPPFARIPLSVRISSERRRSKIDTGGTRR